MQEKLFIRALIRVYNVIIREVNNFKLSLC